LSNISLSESQPACNTNQYGVFCRVYLAIGGHCHALQLQKELNERRTPATDSRKSIHCSIKIKVRLFSVAECGFSQAALFVIEAQHAEDLLNRFNFIACNDAICFADSTHHSKDGFDQLCLGNAQPADHSSLQCFVSDIANKATHEEPDGAACE
jgi:hypothetical protein